MANINLLKDRLHTLRAALIRLEDPNSTEIAPIYKYYTDFGRDLTYNGVVYQSNVVKEVKTIKFTKQLTAHKTKISFTGLDQEQLSLAIDSSSSFLNKSLRISHVFFDSVTEEPIGEEVILMEGIITGASVDDKRGSGVGSSTIEWECANHFQDFQQVTGRITDDYAHRGMVVENGVWVPSVATKKPEYAFDKGFFHANKSTTFLAQYQTEETKYKLNKKSSWFGLSKSYSMQEYTEVVTKEVDLRFDLSAKFIPVIYGTQKVQGIPIFADTDRNDPSQVWIVYAFCEGEIEGFLDFYLDDAPIICFSEADSGGRVCFGRKEVNGDTINLVAGSPGATSPVSVHGQEYIIDDGQGEVSIRTFHGLANQLASSTMVTKATNGEFYLQGLNNQGPEYWDSSFKLLDTAYVICRYSLSDLEGGRTSIPKLEAELRGKIISTYSAGFEQTQTTTSNNMAWQLLDYIKSPVYGLTLPISQFDIQSFEDVANKFELIDDSYEASWVPYWRYLGWTDSIDSQRTTMQTNMVIQTEDTVFKNIQSMLNQTQCSLNKFGGRYFLKVESDDHAVISIDLDDNSIDDITVKDMTGTKKYNTVSASILDPAKGWATNTITFYDGVYKTEDRGVEKKLNISFPFVTNYYTARSIVDRELKKSRFSRSISFTLPYYYLGSLSPNDNINITYKRFSWINKRFIVDSLDILSNGKIQVTVMEFPPDVFINSGQAQVGDNEGVVHTPATLPVRDLTYTPNTTESIANLNGIVSWLPSLSTDISHYTVFYDGAPQLIIVAKPTTGTQTTRVEYPVVDLPIGSYTFTVKAVNLAGKFSAPTSIQVNVTPTKYLPDVTNFVVNNLEPGHTNRFIQNYVHLQWDSIQSSLPSIIYRLQILDINDTILREIEIADSGTATGTFTYTFTQNIEDYTRTIGSLGANRQLKFKIRAESGGTAASYNWSTIN